MTLNPGGCCYRETPGSSAYCNKLCEPGKTFCPHHELLQRTTIEDRERAEAERQRQAKLKLPKAYRE